jgi:hypothetical protein
MFLGQMGNGLLLMDILRTLNSITKPSQTQRFAVTTLSNLSRYLNFIYSQLPYAPLYYSLDVPVMQSFQMMNHGQRVREYIYTEWQAYPNTLPYETIEHCNFNLIFVISIVGWNDWNFVQRFNPGNNIDIISFPAIAATSWTLELRFMKKLTYNELFFKILNFVEITGRNDAGCDFLIGSTIHQS